MYDKLRTTSQVSTVDKLMFSVIVLQHYWKLYIVKTPSVKKRSLPKVV